MPRFDINTYDTVDSRLTRFWEEHPNGAIHTELITDPNTITTFLAIRASVWFDRNDPIPAGQGIAYGQQNTQDSRVADFSSWVENCDTSAVGRALANAGYKAKKDSPRPSREEMVQADRRMSPDERADVDAQHQRNIASPATGAPVAGRAGRTPGNVKPSKETIDDKSNIHQHAQLIALGEAGYDLAAQLAAFGVERMEDLTREQAKEIIIAGRAVVNQGRG